MDFTDKELLLFSARIVLLMFSFIFAELRRVNIKLDHLAEYKQCACSKMPEAGRTETETAPADSG